MAAIEGGKVVKNVTRAELERLRAKLARRQKECARAYDTARATAAAATAALDAYARAYAARVVAAQRRLGGE